MTSVYMSCVCDTSDNINNFPDVQCSYFVFWLQLFKSKFKGHPKCSCVLCPYVKM